MSELVQPEDIAKLLSGKTIVVPTALESSGGEPVRIECYLIPSPYSRRWVLVSALAGQVVVGFVDAQFYGEYGTSKIEAPHTMRDYDPDFPHTEIRIEAGEDGLFVVNKERGRGIGEKIMSVMRSVLKGLGAKVMSVNQPKESAFGFYSKIGMQGGVLGFQVILEDADEQEL